MQKTRGLVVEKQTYEKRKVQYELQNVLAD